MAEVEGELAAGGGFAEPLEERVVAGVLDHDADRPEPVAEALDPRQVGGDPPGLGDGELRREPEAVGHGRRAQRSNCSGAGSR